MDDPATSSSIRRADERPINAIECLDTQIARRFETTATAAERLAEQCTE